MTSFDRIELIDKSNGEEIRANPHLQCPFCLDLLFEPIQCSICKNVIVKIVLIHGLEKKNVLEVKIVILSQEIFQLKIG